MVRSCLFPQRWHSSTRPQGVTTHRTKMWLYWGHVPTFPSQDASNWNFVKFSGAWFMHQKAIFWKRNYLPRYSALPHSYDSSGDSSKLLIVQFLNEIIQGLPQRKSQASCGLGTSLHSSKLARVIRQWSLLVPDVWIDEYKSSSDIRFIPNCGSRTSSNWPHMTSVNADITLYLPWFVSPHFGYHTGLGD